MKIIEFILIFIVTLIVMFVLDLILAYPMMLLWNFVIVALGGPVITFWQMVALSVLIGLLFSSKSIKSN